MGRFLGFEGVDAALFDCDGVLVDSEPISERAWRAALEEFGIHMEDFSDWIGKTDQELAVHFASEAGISPSRLTSLMADRLLEILDQEGVQPFPDTLAALEAAERSNLDLAVVSNSEGWRLDAILSAVGIKDRFSVVVSSDDVTHPKPAPDVYLLAAERLGVPPLRCVVVEDTPIGVSAGRAAGMRVVAVVRGLVPAEELRHATKVVPSLDRALD
ncbi:MAG: HAD family phosphatase [Actinomycetes bacterium]